MKVVLLVISVLAFGIVRAQQLPQYTQWSWHQFALNPAHAGIKKCVDIHSLYRMQWLGVPGAPRSGFMTVSVPLNSKRKQYLSARHGMGFRFESDRIGQFAAQRFNLAYAGHFNFNKTSRLSLGIYGGVIQMGYNPTEVHTHQPDPEVLNEGSFFGADASFGAWFNATDYYIGLILQNLFPTPWSPIGENARNRFHTTINGGYRLGINDRLTFLPNLIVRIPPSGPASADLQLGLDYNNFITVGLGYRNVDAVMAYFQIKFNEQFGIGYSFDYTLSELQLPSKNTHEFSLRFTTCKPDRSSTSACPLFE